MPHRTRLSPAWAPSLCVLVALLTLVEASDALVLVGLLRAVQKAVVLVRLEPLHLRLHHVNRSVSEH